MQYLKCNNCGALNEAKTEYLIFCSSCNKKLENNFTDWIKRNPSRSFEDFKTLQCISEEDIKKIPVQKKAKPRALKYLLAGLIAFVIFFFIAYAYSKSDMSSFIERVKAQVAALEQMEEDWAVREFGSLGLTMETPYELTKTELPLPDNVKALIDQMDSYAFEQGNDLVIMVNSMQYNPMVGEASLQGAADGAVNEVKAQEGVTNFEYAEEAISINNIPGIKQDGSFRKEGLDIAFTNIVLLNEFTVYQVAVLYSSSKQQKQLAATRIIESIQIKKSYE